ncbi:hypothetical protein GCM10009664_13470 [Kitasatospora gansuensis]
MSGPEGPVLRVLHGRPDPVELAATVLVLRAGAVAAAARAGAPPGQGGHRAVDWERPGADHHSAGSWQRDPAPI